MTGLEIIQAECSIAGLIFGALLALIVSLELSKILKQGCNMTPELMQIFVDYMLIGFSSGLGAWALGFGAYTLFKAAWKSRH